MFGYKKRGSLNLPIIIGILLILSGGIYLAILKFEENNSKAEFEAKRKKLISQINDSDSSSDGGSVFGGDGDLDAASIEAANKSILQNTAEICETCVIEDESPNPSMMLSSDGAVGILEIPKFELSLPLHPDTTNSSLNKGVGIMTDFDLPNNKRGGLSVVASHRGGRRGNLTFMNIDKLNVGDPVNVIAEDRYLKYKVSKSVVVEPTDWSQFIRDQNKSTIVLLTCHPYPKNDKRLLVFCDIEHEPEENSYTMNPINPTPIEEQVEPQEDANTEEKVNESNPINPVNPSDKEDAGDKQILN